MSKPKYYSNEGIDVFDFAEAHSASKNFETFARKLKKTKYVGYSSGEYKVKGRKLYFKKPWFVIAVEGGNGQGVANLYKYHLPSCKHAGLTDSWGRLVQYTTDIEKFDKEVKTELKHMATRTNTICCIELDGIEVYNG